MEGVESRKRAWPRGASILWSCWRENEVCRAIAPRVLLLAHLAELDERRLYLDLGFSSLFAYCMEALGLCKSAAGASRAQRICGFAVEPTIFTRRGSTLGPASCATSRATIHRRKARRRQARPHARTCNARRPPLRRIAGRNRRRPKRLLNRLGPLRSKRLLFLGHGTGHESDLAPTFRTLPSSTQSA